MTEAAARARVEDWLAPIADGSPAGEDARYDPLHEEIRNEAAKIDSPTTGTTDWEKVVKDAEKLTKETAKDVLILSYASFGLYQNEGLLGLAGGLFLIAESMDRFWEDMYPPVRRIRARVNAVAWLVDKLDTTLPETQVGQGDHDAVDALEAAVNRLREVVGEKFEDQAPAIRPMVDTVQRLKMSLPERADGGGASDTEPPPAPAAEAAPAAAAPAAAPAEAAPAAAPAAEPEPAGEDLEAKLTDSAKKWTEPVPGDAPAGIDAKYELSHEELRNDITALDTPTGSQLDWSTVIARGGGILENTSKDLLIASYVAYALYETKGLEGLATGFEIITQLCDKYWDEGFPPARRIRGRANALSWLLDRLEPRLPEVKLTADDAQSVELLEISVKRFTATVRDKFEDAAPSVRPLQDTVQRLKMSVPAKAAPKPEPKPQAAAAPQASAPRPAPASSGGGAAMPSASVEVGDLTDAKEIKKFAKEVGGSLGKAAKSIRDASLEEPFAYHFQRLAIMAGQGLPPADNGQTRIPPPNERMVSDMERHLNEGNWEELIKAAETAIPTKPVWLDLHRFTAVALSNLGGKFAEAHTAVLAATAFYVKRFPELLDYSFNGGMPFASELTKEWINTEVLPAGDGGGGGGGEGAEVLSAARSLAAGGKVDEALEALTGLANGARSGRARFAAKLAMAQTLSGKAAPVADGIFEALGAEIEGTSLEQWDPELAADCYRSHLACLKAMKKESDAPDRAAVVFRRLCRVDPMAAAKAGGPG